MTELALNKQEGGDHYKNLKIQPIEYIYANDIPFIEGCIIKYATRWRSKNGIEDLKKIIHFAEILIDLEQKKIDETGWNTLSCESCHKVTLIKGYKNKCPHCQSEKIRIIF